MRCATAETDMGTFTCPDTVCVSRCKKTSTSTDPIKYIPPFSELCDDEISLIKKFPAEALLVRKAQQTALEETHARFGGNFRDDESDAFRHCIWAALLVSNLKSKDATVSTANTWLNAHESCSNDPKGTAMDLFNNQIGVQIAHDHPGDTGVSVKTYGDSCERALSENRLRVIHPSKRHP